MQGSNKEENYHITEIPVPADILSDIITKNVKMHAHFYQENMQQLFIKPLHFSVFYGHGTYFFSLLALHTEKTSSGSAFCTNSAIFVYITSN